MRYKNCRCVSCNNIFTETDDVVVCPVCGSPHHRECWMNEGKCANNELHADGFEWIYPEELRERKQEKRTEPKAAPFIFKNGENAVICPHCQSLNYGNDALCIKCRKPLYEDKRDGFGEMNTPSDAGGTSENPDSPAFGGMPYGGTPHNQNEAQRGAAQENYDFYQRFGGLRPDILVSGIPAAELADYIGEKQSGRYIRRFAASDRFGRRVSFSICAFLFGPIWFLYRKLYKEGIIYLVISIILAAGAGICSITQPVRDMYAEMSVLYSQVLNGETDLAEFEKAVAALEEEYSNVIPPKEDNIKITLGYVISIASTALTLGMSLFANHLYLKKIKKDIFAIREECNDMQSYRNMLRSRGGVSVGGAILGAMGTALAYFVQLIPSYMLLFRSMM